MCNKEYGGSVVPSRPVLSVVLVGEADGPCTRWTWSPTDVLRCFEETGAGALVTVDNNGSPFVLRVTLRTLPRSEGVLLPLVHDHLRGLQQSGKQGLGRVGRVRLELSLEVFLKQCLGTILLVGILAVDVGLRELGKECGFVLHWHVAKISERRD